MDIVNNESTWIVSRCLLGLSRLHSRSHENGIDAHPAKRHHLSSPHGNTSISPNGILNLSNGPIRLEDISISRELREREKLERERGEKDRPDGRDAEFERERRFSSSSSFSKCVNKDILLLIMDVILRKLK